MAQELTPWPMSFCSEGRFSQRADAPEAMMSVRVSMPFAIDIETEGALGEVDFDDGAVHVFGAEMLGLLLHVLDEIGTVDAFRKAGKVLDERW